MSGTPTVSVIVPTFNRPRMTLRAVSSILDGAATDWEVVVVDDASADDAAAAIEVLRDRRVRYVRREINGGVAASQNTGLSVAQGRFVSFLHSDDTMCASGVAESVRVLAAQPKDVVAVEARARFTGGGANDEAGPFVAGRDRDSLFRFATGVHISTLVFRRERMLRFDERLRGWEDWDLLIRLASEGRIIPSEHVVVEIHLHDGPRLSAPSTQRDALCILRDKYAVDIRRLDVEGLWAFKLARFDRRLRDVQDARRHLRESLNGLSSRDAGRWALWGSTFLGSRGLDLAWSAYEGASRLRRGRSARA